MDGSVAVLGLTAMGAAEAAQQSPQWWQIITGILGVPTAAIGILVAYRTSQKIRLENLKLQRELLQQPAPTEGRERFATQQELRQTPVAFTATVQDFMVRFIVLYLTLVGYQLLEGSINIIVGSGFSVLSYSAALPGPVTIVGPLATGLLTSIGRWVIYLALGYPLLRDILDFFGLSLRDLLTRRS